MTPAINAARKAKLDYQVHMYDHDPRSHSYGEEAVIKLSLDAARVFKTLIVETDGDELVVAVISVPRQLDFKLLCDALGAKKAAMSDQKAAERATGYLAGGISPIGQKKRLRTVIDESGQAFETVFVSAGRRGLEIELAPTDLASLTGASFAPISR
jgi:Cys-tRNA(Pro)/Cys-tRNA(Cys) deacylase